MSVAIVRKVVTFLSIALFFVALTQPCFDTKQEAGDVGEGFALLISGFFGLFSGTGLAWLANPALLASWICAFIKRPNRAFLFSLIASLFAWSFMGFTTIMVDEAGHFSAITNYRPGYWLWLGSNVVMTAGSLAVLIIGGYQSRRRVEKV